MGVKGYCEGNSQSSSLTLHWLDEVIAHLDYGYNCRIDIEISIIYSVCKIITIYPKAFFESNILNL